MITDQTHPTHPLIVATAHWLDKAVIGLDLCPFAKAVRVKQRVRFVVSAAANDFELLAELAAELSHLQHTSPDITDTTLLILPTLLADFADFNQFLGEVEVLLQKLELEGDFQVADFHPNYQFADAAPDDISNYTNRTPYPTLHLLRESSIDKAVAAFPDASVIYQKNIATLNKLGLDGWHSLMQD